MIGLCNMGRNLVYNMLDHGYAVIGFDKNNAQLETFKKEADNDNIFAKSNRDEFLKALKTSKVIFMLVPGLYHSGIVIGRCGGLSPVRQLQEWVPSGKFNTGTTR